MLGQRDHRAFWTSAYREDVEYVGPQPPEADPILMASEYADASDKGKSLFDDLKEMRDVR